ncbi:MAG: TMEM175 family protein [Ferruginibacter sp.]
MTGNKHPKNDFMIERIAFFSDAVFAIAITLMAIEIHPPMLKKGDTSHEIWEYFKEVIPEFIGLLVSFWLIASVWLRHHQLFKYIDNFDIRFMVANLWLLFTIILFPFTTAFLFNSIFSEALSKIQVFLYLGVPLCSNLLMYIMYKRVNRKHLNGAADMHFHKAVLSQLILLISFILVITWVAIMPMAYHPFGYSFFGLVPLMAGIFKKKVKKHD